MLAAAVEQNRGWGGPAAILIALGAFFAYTQYREWWQARKIDNPSPPPPAGRGDDEDSQVGDGVTDDGTPDVTDDETPNDWGQVRTRLADGSVLVRRARAIWRTGSSRLPEGDELTAGPAGKQEDQEGVDEVGGETRDEFADRLVAVPIRYTAAVDTIVRTYGVSERTAKRDLAAAQARARS